MNEQDKNKYEIMDTKNSKLAKINNNTKLLIDNIVDKIGEIPSFAKDILKSSDKSEENYNDLVKQDKNIIELVIKEKIETGNYTDEELNSLLDRTQKITEKQERMLDKLNKHKKEILLIVATATAGVLKMMLENRNKA